MKRQLYIPLNRKRQLRKQNTLARLCEPRIERLIDRGIAKVVKQSLQLVNLEIASPAATFI